MQIYLCCFFSIKMGDAEVKRFLIEQKSKCEQLLKEGKSNFVFCANNCLMNNVLNEIKIRICWNK